VLIIANALPNSESTILHANEVKPWDCPESFNILIRPDLTLVSTPWQEESVNEFAANCLLGLSAEMTLLRRKRPELFSYLHPIPHRASSSTRCFSAEVEKGFSILTAINTSNTSLSSLMHNLFTLGGPTPSHVTDNYVLGKNLWKRNHVEGGEPRKLTSMQLNKRILRTSVSRYTKCRHEVLGNEGFTRNQRWWNSTKLLIMQANQMKVFHKIAGNAT